MRRDAWFAAALLFGFAVRAHALAPEPANLSLHKLEIRSYVDSGAYRQAIGEVAMRASAWLEDRARVQLRADQGAAPAARLAVVFDLDETLISNLPSMRRQDFGYVPEAWDAWVRRSEAPAIEPMRQLYALARRLHLAVVILSSRPERDRAATEKNLQAIGCGDWTRLMLQPDDLQAKSGVFKRAERVRLASEGFILIANIGDQESDFLGGGAERDFKLPNPFYLTE